MGSKKRQRHASHLSESISEAVSDYVGSARDKTGPVLADAKDRAVPVLVDARDKAAPVLVMARDKAAPYFSEARDKAGPVLSSARDNAAPVLDRAAPVLSDAKERFTAEVLPVVTAAISALESATEDARGEAGKRTKALGAALKGEVAPPPKKHTGRNILLVLGLGGAAFAVAKKLTSKQPTTSWQSSYTPPPVPTPSSTGGPVTDVGAHRADTPTDTAAAGPGEAVADAAEAPHDATTPDNPATEVDVDPSAKD